MHRAGSGRHLLRFGRDLPGELTVAGFLRLRAAIRQRLPDGVGGTGGGGGCTGLQIARFRFRLGVARLARRESARGISFDSRLGTESDWCGGRLRRGCARRAIRSGAFRREIVAQPGPKQWGARIEPRLPQPSLRRAPVPIHPRGFKQRRQGRKWHRGVPDAARYVPTIVICRMTGTADFELAHASALGVRY